MSIHKQATSQPELGDKWRASHSALTLVRPGAQVTLHTQRGGQYQGLNGPVDLSDLMQDHSQLVLYHFKLATSAHEGPSASCPGCTRYIDSIDSVALKHLAERDTAFALVSRAPVDALEAYRNRMSWRHTWVSASAEAQENSENHGISIYTRDGNQICRKYISVARGMENLGPIWTVLDLPTTGPLNTAS